MLTYVSNKQHMMTYVAVIERCNIYGVYPTYVVHMHSTCTLDVTHVPASRPRAGLGGGILMLHLWQHQCYIDVTLMLHRCRGGGI